MRWERVADPAELSRRAADLLLEAVTENPRIVLGLPTGRTPEGMYREVVRRCRLRTFCFRDVRSFNLDEYAGIPSTHPGSYRSYMRRHLFDHTDIRESGIHLPEGDAHTVRSERPGLTLEEALAQECLAYEDQIAEVGGLDLTFLGLGRNGHIAFNEPGTPFDSRTHVIELDPSTRAANAACFPGEEVPRKAITMGIETILESRRIVLLASGSTKREAVRRLREGSESVDFPASALHRHPDVTVFADHLAWSPEP